MNYRVILSYLSRCSIPLVRPKSWDLFTREPAEVKKFVTEHVQGLTPDQLASLEHYGFAGYFDINRHLRGEMNEPAVEEHIDNIDAALDKNTLKTDITVYRGIDTAYGVKHPILSRLVELGAISLKRNRIENSRIVFENIGLLPRLRGFKFVEPSYTSTSIKRGLFGMRDLQLRILVPHGTHAIFLNAMHQFEGESGVRDFGGHKSEQELLLDRGLTFEVVAIQPIDGNSKLLVDLRVES